MRRLAFMFLAFLVSVQSSAQQPIETKQKNDQDILQGVWIIYGLETGGKGEGGGGYKGSFFFSKDKVTLKEPTYQLIEYTFSLDSAKAPKSIDLTIKDHVIHGIYKLEKDKLDNDELTLCVSMAGQRPVDFTTKAGSDCERFTMRRKYTDKNMIFAIDLPGKPEERVRRIETPAGPAASSFLVVKGDPERLAYLVSIVPLARKLNEKELEETSDTLRKSMLTELAVTPSSPPEPGKDFRSGPYQVREWNISSDLTGSKDKAVTRIRIFVAGEKLYGLMITGVDNVVPSRFLNSFELLTKP